MTANLPVQAVEAAARAIHRGDGSTSKEEWESLPLVAILGFRALARLALSAALPHLAPTVDRDTIAQLQDELARYRTALDEACAALSRVRHLANGFTEVKAIAPDDALLRKIAKYSVPAVLNRHVTTSVLAKVADDLHAALDGGRP